LRQKHAPGPILPHRIVDCEQHRFCQQFISNQRLTAFIFTGAARSLTASL